MASSTMLSNASIPLAFSGLWHGGGPSSYTWIYVPTGGGERATIELFGIFVSILWSFC